MQPALQNFASITEFHRASGLPDPSHPLISLVDYGALNFAGQKREKSWVQDFYAIGLKRNIQGKFRYGQQQCDFDGGLMAFIAPAQVVHISIDRESAHKPTGWLLLVHPDFLWGTPLAKNIRRYDFFGYAANEALFMSAGEEQVLEGVLQNIAAEYGNAIDAFSQGIMAAQLEVLLNYCNRYYQRQFITRQISSHRLIGRLESLLTDYFDADDLIEKGLPTVEALAGRLGVSAPYLANLLKTHTGHTTQHFIHEKLIAKAKEKLRTTTLTISEIAYALGFEHSQSFSKLFKAKTAASPGAFRDSFN